MKNQQKGTCDQSPGVDQQLVTVGLGRSSWRLRHSRDSSGLFLFSFVDLFVRLVGRCNPHLWGGGEEEEEKEEEGEGGPAPDAATAAASAAASLTASPPWRLFKRPPLC